MADKPVPKTPPVNVEKRRPKDDDILNRAQAHLNAFEKRTGQPVGVSVDDSVNAGNCRSGVIEWRAKNAGGRAVIPAQEILHIARTTRDRIPYAVRGVYKAIHRMQKAKKG